jgi:hypothetical protein
LAYASGTTAKSTKNETKYELFSRNKAENEINRNEIVDCNLFVRNEDSSKFVMLTEHSLVNIVDVRLVIERNDNTTYTKPAIWVNSVGREILTLLDMEKVLVTSTLNAGRRSIEIHITKQPKGCALTNVNYYAEMNFMKLYGEMLKPGEELCFSLLPTIRKPRQCCKIIKSGTKNKGRCYPSSSSQLVAHLTPKLITPIYFSLSLLTLNALYICALFLQQFPYGGNYYKLSGRPSVSLSRIFIEIAWGESCYTSLFRIFCLLLFGISGLFAFVTLYDKYTIHLYILYTFYSPVCLFSPLFSTRCTCTLECYRSPPRNSSGTRLLNFLVRYYEKVFDAKSIEGNEFHRAVHLLTLPFNIQLWKNAILNIGRNKLSRWARNLTNNNNNNNTTNTTNTTNNTTTTTTKNKMMKCAFYFSCIFILFSYIVILIVFTTIILGINLCYNAAMISSIFHGLAWPMNCSIYYILPCLTTCFMLLSASFLWVLIPHATIPLFSGLILNSIYYFPYITLISVASFYTWASWKSLTGEYLALKILIYEALVQQKKSNNNVDPDEINDDQHIVYVVSKKLYNNIRERLLPYHSKFLVFFLKLLLISIFAFGVFTLVKMLQAVDSSPTVTVIASLTTGALPYILNIAMERMSEEKKAQNEIMKGNVERLVKRFTNDDNPELLKTILILPEPETSEPETREQLMHNITTSSV